MNPPPLNQPHSTSRKALNYRPMNTRFRSRFAAAVTTVALYILGSSQSHAQEKGLAAWWSFSSDRQQGTSIKAHLGPNISPSGAVRYVDDPPPGRVELAGRDERLVVSESISKLDMPEQDVTVEAWVRVDQPLQWGGIFSAIQDNGEFERGLLLGYRNDQFAFAVATEKGGSLTYLTADTAFDPGHWSHVVGTYDGSEQRIYVNGRLAGRSTSQSGPIWYAPSGPVVVAAYQDDNELYSMTGALEEIRVFTRALSEDEIGTRYELRKSEFPLPAPKPIRLALPYGPFVDWIDRTTASITWETDSEMPTTLELIHPDGPVSVAGDPTISLRHEVTLTDLDRDTEYLFRLHAPDIEGVEHVSKRYMFDTSFHYQPVAAPPATDVSEDRADAVAVAAEILERSGIHQGWGYVLGVVDGRVALELVRKSDLKLVLVEKDPERVQAARKTLSKAGVYGVRASVHHVVDDELPYGAALANLIVSESALKSGLPPGWSAAEIHRLLRPSGGVMLMRSTSAQASSQWTSWLSGGEIAGIRQENSDKRWWKYERGRLPGSGDWSHQYGSANNSSSSLDEEVRGELEVSWWGDPGPRPMPDRGPRNPAPLSVNGRLYIQGDRILFGVDAYNGSVLWSVIAPEVRRTNLPRDSSNTVADDRTLYVAHNSYCIEFDGQTGQRGRRHQVPSVLGKQNYDWGYLSVTDGHLIGSRVRSDSRYMGDDGEWYEDYHPDQISRVVSDKIFGRDLAGADRFWEYQRGAIINSTITIGDGMIFFIESRNPEALEVPSGRAHPDLLTDTHLVALDLRSGSKLWEKAHDFSKLQFMSYLVYDDNIVVATGTDKEKHFHTYAFTAPSYASLPDQPQTSPLGGQPLWVDAHKEDKGHHSGHLQHPVVVDGVFYSDQRAFDLKTGETLRTDLPERRGCGTMSAGRHALFFRHYFHGMWDLESNKRTQFEGIRGGCWLGLIPAGGMLLAPESSAGCSCTHAIQTSVGYSPKIRSMRP